jgi:hypothetical protein
MVYGYAVCLVTVIAFLIAGANLVYALIDLGDPMNAYRNWRGDAPSLASFDNYKVDIIKATDPEHGLDLDDTTLRSMFDAAKNDAISKVKHNATRSLIVNSLVVVVALLLFLIHWMWMRRLTRKPS